MESNVGFTHPDGSDPSETATPEATIPEEAIAPSEPTAVTNSYTLMLTAVGARSLVFGTQADELGEELDAAVNPDFDAAADFVFGGAGSDSIDTSSSQFGQNRLYGGSDDDELIPGTRDRVFGGDGNDVIDASAGGGNNRLYGQAGRDDLIAGRNDRLFGGEGDDRLFIVTGGNNVLTGGEGADQFWIAVGEFPEAASTITDYNTSEDVIGIAGLGASFESLDLTQQDADTSISFEGEELAVLLGVEATNLSSSHFTFA